MGVRVVNLTNFFNRELFMYSLGDIKFKKPIALKKVAYITAFIVLWTVPSIMILGLPNSPFKVMFSVVIPVAAGHFASKPIFGGKGLIDFLKTLTQFMGEPKSWLDFKPSNDLDEAVYYVENEIWISRRRELDLLEKAS